MKNNCIYPLAIVLFLMVYCNTNSFSQDIIHKKNKETIRAKVLEIGIDEIKYKEFDNLDGPIIVISKTDVVLIKYENGSEFRISLDPYAVDKEVEVRNKSHAIKFEFFSPLTNDIVFGYEHMLKVGTNLEIKAGVIGPGTNKTTAPASGFLFKAGIKFLQGSDYTVNGMKFVHQLKGKYIKPEIIFNSYSTESQVSYYNSSNGYYSSSMQNIQYTNLAINIVFGKQTILGNIMTLDYYLGMGYGIQSSNYPKNNLQPYGIDNSSHETSYSYSHIYCGKDFPMIFSAGLTLGVMY